MQQIRDLLQGKKAFRKGGIDTVVQQKCGQFQIILNVGMCLYVLPVMGLTLPFISYGGTSVMTLFACMGIVSSVKAKTLPSWLRNR